MSDHFQDEGAKGAGSQFETGIWPPEQARPCTAVSTRSPEIALYLSLHCPRCGQLANLADKTAPLPCLLEVRPASQFHLNGEHHEYNQ